MMAMPSCLLVSKLRRAQEEEQVMRTGILVMCFQDQFLGQTSLPQQDRLCNKPCQCTFFFRAGNLDSCTFLRSPFALSRGAPGTCQKFTSIDLATNIIGFQLTSSWHAPDPHPGPSVRLLSPANYICVYVHV